MHGGFHATVKLATSDFMHTPPAQRTPDVDPSLILCWASVADGDINRHWLTYVSCMLGTAAISQNIDCDHRPLHRTAKTDKNLDNLDERF